MNKDFEKSNKPTPLQIESSQLATITLLLEGVEDDVTIKACISLYKYIEKNDENKQNLLDLKCLKKLLNLLCHQCLIVRRLSIMIIASLSSIDNGRRAIRLKENSIPLIIKLLNNNDDPPIREHASLCFVFLCEDASARANICRSGGLIPLVESLQSHDPDVVKNTVQALALILQDFDSKTAFLQCNGIQQLIPLIESDFKIIQYHALIALQQLAKDYYCRENLKNEQFISCLVTFLNKDLNKDLHVFVIVLLSCIINDDKSVLAFQNTDGVTLLLKLLTTNQPIVETEIKTKKDNKAVPATASSRAKSRKGKSEDSKFDEKELIDINDLSNIEKPNLNEYIIKIFVVLLDNESCEKMLHELNIEELLFANLEVENEGSKAACLEALFVLTKYEKPLKMIKASSGCIDTVLNLCKTSGDGKVLEAATLLLCNLTFKDDNFIKLLENKRVIDVLPVLLSRTEEYILSNASTLIYNLCLHYEMRIAMNKLLIPQTIKSLLKTQVPSCIFLDANSSISNTNQNAKTSHSTASNKRTQNASQQAVNKSIQYSDSNLLQRKFLMLLSIFAIDCENIQAIESEDLDCIIFLLSSNDEEVRKNSAWLLSSLVDDWADLIIKKGGFEKLLNIQQSVTQSNYFSELALYNLLERRSIEKFALLGCLSNHNTIQDGFYDVGQLGLDNLQQQLKALEHYAGLPINSERPIYLVNALNQIAVEKLDEKKVSLEAIQSVQSNKSIKTKKLEIEKAAEVEASPPDNYPKNFEPPVDLPLIGLIEETFCTMQNLATTKDQIVALAKIVSGQMGGQIYKEDVDNYDVTDHINNLKQQLQSNIIPIGHIHFGAHYHRALLYKVLADRVGVPCSLFRGSYNKSWIQVMLLEENCNGQLDPVWCLVDLLVNPGQLLAIQSDKAQEYCKF